LAALAAAPAAAQEWEVFFDSEGFEGLAVGELDGTTPLLLPHLLRGAGSGAQVPKIVAPPEPAMGARSLRFEPHYITQWDRTVRIDYGHLESSFGRAFFGFPGADRGG